jgi:hypothetical protein
MIGFRGSMAWVRRTQLQSALLVLVLTEAIRPELAKSLADARRQILQAAQSSVVDQQTPPRCSTERRESTSIKESTSNAYERLVVKARSLLPPCDLGAAARMHFEEFLAEQKPEGAEQGGGEQ